MSNLYEILEVSEKASKEVIDKAYHVLVKKYHPDLQQEEEKQNAEEKMKQINEAYEILSNEEKRREYDIALENERKQEEKDSYVNVQRQETANQETYNENSNQNVYKNQRVNENTNYKNQKKIQKEINRAYANAYNDYLRGLGYKVKEPWTFKKFLEQLKILGILAIVFITIWIFPPTHKMLVDVYEGNIIIKTLVDVIISIVLGIFNGIKKIIFNIFRI